MLKNIVISLLGIATLAQADTTITGASFPAPVYQK